MTGLEIVGAVLSTVSAATGAIGAIQQAGAQANAAKYNAAVAQRSRQVAINQAAVERDDTNLAHRRVLASMHAAYGASGFDTGSGSALDAMADSAAESALDEKRITYKGDLKALGYSDQISLNNAQASNATTAGYVGAAGSVLKAGTSLLAGGKGTSLFGTD